MNFFFKFLENVLRHVCCLLNFPSTPTPIHSQYPPRASHYFSYACTSFKKIKEILRVKKFFDKNDVFLYKTPFVIYFYFCFRKMPILNKSTIYCLKKSILTGVIVHQFQKRRYIPLNITPNLTKNVPYILGQIQMMKKLKNRPKKNL